MRYLWMLLLAGVLPLRPAAALQAEVVARFTPEAGRIADAAVICDGHLALCYPDAGHIADYTFDGRLFQHIVREGGEALRFRPTACAARGSEGLLVFDEADHKLFTIAADGNIETGVDLAFSTGEGPALALASLGDIGRGPAGTLYVLLPQRSALAAFDAEGSMTSSLDLKQALPYKQAVYNRFQFLPDSSLFILDYHQGGIAYRRGADGPWRRISLGAPKGLGAAVQAQDFAVDDAGNVVLATYNPEEPLMLLTPGAAGYAGRQLDLKLARAPHRISLRHSRGTFILWIREKPSVTLFRLR